MKNANKPPNDPLGIPAQPKAKAAKHRVSLEPELEEIACLWPPAKRFEMARKFRRWARQLRISGIILFHDSHPGSRPALRFLSRRTAPLN
ncbi:MAG: hypothetical protein ABSH48_02160 [Verrucomicrobiota bacterium]|jgi:hypothetical protein